VFYSNIPERCDSLVTEKHGAIRRARRVEVIFPMLEEEAAWLQQEFWS
jgi:hypothetical protein